MKQSIEQQLEKNGHSKDNLTGKNDWKDTTFLDDFNVAEVIDSSLLFSLGCEGPRITEEKTPDSNNM